MKTPMQRRDFITRIGTCAVVTGPLVARAQTTAVPVIGYLGSSEEVPANVAAFRRGLKEGGYTDGQNVAIEFRWADGQYERLPALATELIERPVAVLLAGGPPAALAAKNATTRTPVVFTSGEDPVQTGLVASLARPGGNVTGISLLHSELVGKRLELFRELLPKAKTVGLFHAPGESSIAFDLAAARMGLRVVRVSVASKEQLDGAFATLAAQKVDGVVNGSGPLFGLVLAPRINELAARAGLPVLHETPRYVAAGALMGYGSSSLDAYRLAGIYVAKVLKGEKPANLPVVQPTRFILAINLKTAKALGIKVPPSLLARADEIFE